MVFDSGLTTVSTTSTSALLGMMTVFSLVWILIRFSAKTPEYIVLPTWVKVITTSPSPVIGSSWGLFLETTPLVDTLASFETLSRTL